MSYYITAFVLQTRILRKREHREIFVKKLFKNTEIYIRSFLKTILLFNFTVFYHSFQYNDHL